MNAKRTLYRNRRAGKVAGVCAGVAEYFNLETWLVRVAVVSIFLLGGSGVVFVAYIALWMILDEKPYTVAQAENDLSVKAKVWQAGEPAKKALQDVSTKFNNLENRLRAIETYVTSDQYELKRQINNL